MAMRRAAPLFAAAIACSPTCWAEGAGRKFPGEEAQPDVNVEGFQAVLDWSQNRIKEGARAFDSKGFKRQPSPASWNDETVYYVMVDRFANGDLRNDHTNIPDFQKDQLKSDAPFSVGDWRHGGDLEGLRQRLGYLQDLGVGVIWISPILLQASGQAYGYYMTDPSMIDPGFGSKDLFRQLVHEAHERGMYVIMDVVTNMLTSPGFGYESPPSIDQVTACVISSENHYWNGSFVPDDIISNRSALTWGTNVPPYLRNETFFQRCGAQNQYRPDGQKFENMPLNYKSKSATLFEAGLLWPEAFHSPGDMPDFATMNPTFQELFANLLNYWTAYADIDGFRFDAAKYTTADYMAYLSTHTRNYAAKLGKKNFFITGEILSPGAVPFLYLYLGHQASVEDSPECPAHPGCAGLVGDCCPNAGGMLACCFNDFVKEKPVPKHVREMNTELADIASTLSSPGPALPVFYPTDEHDFFRDVAQGKANASSWWSNEEWQEAMTKVLGVLKEQGIPEWTWMFVESQDIKRLLQEPSMGGDLWRLKVGLAWTYTWYGMPTLYYGMEQGFNGMCYSYKDGVMNKEAHVSSAIDPDVAADLQATCEAGTKDSLKRQDMFTNGPWMLGSAVPSVQKTAMIDGRMPSASPPHWCEESVIDRSNEVYQLSRALARIRKSCPTLSGLMPMQAGSTNPSHMAYWKLRNDSATTVGSPVLVVLDMSADPTTDKWSFSLPPAPFDKQVSSSTSWVDLLNPERTAVLSVPALGGAPSLSIDNNPGPANVAIFVDANEAQADGTWHVCKAGAAKLLPLSETKECESTFMWMTLVGIILYVGIVLIALLRNLKNNGVFLCVVKEPSPVEILEVPSPERTSIQDPKHIFVAAIEHTIPERKVKVSAGGLGKVLDQMLKEHPPGRLSLVHPKFAGVEYGPLEHFTTLEVTVDMQKQRVDVHTMQSTDGDLTRVWFLLEHEWFETQISKDNPYPYPQTKLSVLRFFSLWNQACAQMLMSLKPDIYHCMDYHAAMVPLYIAPSEQVPTIIVLHNADYDGAIETDFISDVFWKSVPALRRLSLIFNLDRQAIRKYLTFEGRFNMLWGGIACIEENQGGHGICTVSGKYAAELKRERTMFKGLPAVLPLDNAIDSAADDGPKSVNELKAMRAVSKKALQEFCELKVDPEAKILIFVGRWVKQKGVDHIALLASQILDDNPEVQFVLAGPPGDPYGSYAQELLRPLADSYPGRLFVVTKFFMIPKEARAGAHLCLMPSCSEPFGYVDVEFGLLGVPSLGCAIGGLGKMPGVYFRQQNSDSQEMLLAGFSAAVKYALKMPESKYWKMAFNCIPAQFPFSTWRANLQVIYRHAQLNFDRTSTSKRTEPLTLDQGYEVLREDSKKRFMKGPYRGISSTSIGDEPQGTKKKTHAAKVQHQLLRMQVTEATEFLTQPVSEQRVKELMSFWMATESREVDAETLQSHISLANSRMNERSFATRGLMRNNKCLSWFIGDGCLRIHTVIALGYIISPVMDARLEYLLSNAKSLEGRYSYEIMSLSAYHWGCFLGCFLWLRLSRAVPANLLMAVALFLNQLFFSLTSTFMAFTAPWLVVVFELVCGVLTTSRWLFLIWNFNEDFHGGFQIGTRRVALIESLRSCLAGLLTIKVEHFPTGIVSTMFSAANLLLIIMIMLAPSCYSSYVLPSTNFWRELKDHKVYLLFVLSMSLNGLAAFVWLNTASWLGMNGWHPNEVSFIEIVESVVLILSLSITFLTLHRMSIWGPWAMRDFTCFVPPGSLLFALSFWELGHLHYRSYIFVAALIVGSIVDVARFAAFWTAILTTLANKWYALLGAFAGFAVVQACQAVSPLFSHILAWPWGVSPTWSGLVPHHPETNLAVYQKAVMASVWPLAILAYIAQVMAWRHFVPEVLTYKGHGNLMPDGTKGWDASETAFVKASAIASSQGFADDDDEDSDGSTDESSSDDETGRLS
mmetsp:Transcript_103399/g.299071  ORF Transcript_103399/g.299071 Transcript_103399/m.299071 type:complete len:1957 (-) Transcript_103399:212-6082(-)